MARNIIFVTLFILLYGGLFLLGSHKDSKLTDRNDYGVFNGASYESEHFGVKMDFNDDWIVFDGVSIEESVLSRFSRDELAEAYGAPLNELAFIAGAASPIAEIYCTSYLDAPFTESDLSETATRSMLDRMKNTIEGQGGSVGSASCKTVSAKGNSTPMLIYYYDYEIGGEYFSVFMGLANSGENAIMLEGVYDSYDGLKTLIDFAENNFYVNSDTQAAV